MVYLVRFIVCCTLSFFYLISSALEVTVDSVKPFTSLCVAENSTGFNWRGGKWVQTNFKSEKYLLQKINYEKGMSLPSFIDQPHLCKKPSITGNVNSVNVIVEACYAVRVFGKPLIAVSDAQQCLESFVNGSLSEIYCVGVGRFKPNGLFVKLPSSSSTMLGNDVEKDSMALEVGTCSVL